MDRKLAAVVVALVIAVTTSVTTQNAPGGLIIASAHADFAGGTMTIVGQNFGSAPRVYLSGQPLVVQASTSSQIVAALPPASRRGRIDWWCRSTAGRERSRVTTRWT